MKKELNDVIQNTCVGAGSSLLRSCFQIFCSKLLELAGNAVQKTKNCFNTN